MNLCVCFLFFFCFYVLVCSFSMLMRSVFDILAFVLCFFVVECSFA